MRELAALWDLGTNGKVLHQSEIMSTLAGAATVRRRRERILIRENGVFLFCDEYDLKWEWMRDAIGKDGVN